MATLSTAESHEKLSKLTGWALESGAITRIFTFASFPDALAFVVRLGFTAESADHHPDILVSYKRVTLTYVTHSEGGLTGKDFDGAAQASAIAEARGGS